MRLVVVADWMIPVAVSVALGGYVGIALLIAELRKWLPEWRALIQARKIGRRE